MRRRIDAQEPHRCHAFAGHPEFARRAMRQVEAAAAHEWPAVIDPHRHGAAVLDIHHADDRADRDRGRGGGQLLGIEAFAVTGTMPRESRPIPRRSDRRYRCGLHNWWRQRDNRGWRRRQLWRGHTGTRAHARADHQQHCRNESSGEGLFRALQGAAPYSWRGSQYRAAIRSNVRFCDFARRRPSD